jgi:hypothetical protein
LTFVTSPAHTTALVLRLQLILLAVTWLAGIYVNGFVAIIPGETAVSILLTPAVALHVIFASASGATSLTLVALARVVKARWSMGLLLVAALSIALAGASGLSFVLGGAVDADESMSMATGFVTALFLTFLSLVSLPRPPHSPGATMSSKPRTLPLVLCYCALALMFAVFVSGIYVNLFVAGPVFSLPLDAQLAAFQRAEATWPFVLHEALGGFALVLLVVLSIVLLTDGVKKRPALMGAVAASLVAYSAYVGSLNLTSPLSPVSGGTAAVLIPMASAAAFIGAINLTMLLTLRIMSA